MDFVPLVQGNWFELKPYQLKLTQPYMIDNLKTEITEQVKNHDKKLDFIDVKYPKLYANAQIEDIKIDITKDRFDQIVNLASSEKFHPMLTFHGTTDMDVIHKIIKYGYLLPGDIDPETGNKITVKHGRMFGHGIYTSPHFDKALYYSYRDATYVYMLVNLIFVGKIKMISSDFRLDNEINADTNIVFGLDQIISKDPKRVIPVGTIRIKI
jgi:hypothetical protein